MVCRSVPCYLNTLILAARSLPTSLVPISSKNHSLGNCRHDFKAWPCRLVAKEGPSLRRSGPSRSIQYTPRTELIRIEYPLVKKIPGPAVSPLVGLIFPYHELDQANHPPAPSLLTFQPMMKIGGQRLGQCVSR